MAGISLLSDSVMKLVHVKEPEKFVNMYLPRLSFYVLAEEFRYEFTHEILSPEKSQFEQSPVKRARRVSVVCRSEPNRKE